MSLRKKLCHTLVFTAFIWSFSGMAQTDLPWQKLQLVGEGKLRVLFWDIYKAQLFSASGSYKEQEYPVALRLTYLRDFSKKNLISETANQWEKLGYRDARIESWLNTLQTLWQDVREDDSITLYVDADQSSYFYLNEDELGKVDDPEFTSAFLAIWLSEKTSEPKVRRQLIAGSKNG